MTTETTLSWWRIEQDIRQLANLIIESGYQYEGILAVVRGGLVPAALLLRYLPPSRLFAVALGKKISFPFGIDTTQSYLLVDDLCDTGRTVKDIKTFFPRCKTAVLYTKPAGASQADFSVRQYPQDCWLVLPWEIEDSRINPLSGLEG